MVDMTGKSQNEEVFTAFNGQLIFLRRAVWPPVVIRAIGGQEFPGIGDPTRHYMSRNN